MAPKKKEVQGNRPQQMASGTTNPMKHPTNNAEMTQKEKSVGNQKTTTDGKCNNQSNETPH